MGNYLFLTRDKWEDFPRLRHQCADLLLKNGHSVDFVECVAADRISVAEKSANLRIARIPRVLHHQLKPFEIIQTIFNIKMRRNLKELIGLLGSRPDGVLNFNYDFWFAREQFSNSEFITVLSDDPVNQVKPFMRNAALTQTRKTLQISDRSFAPAHVIVDRYVESANISFLPRWSETGYIGPKGSAKRDTVCYYGYVNRRIDFSLVDAILSAGTKLRMSGPISGNEAQIRSEIGRLQKKHRHFEYHEPAQSGHINFDDICCAVDFYRTDLRSVNDVSMSNRTIQLLSNGIPCIVSGERMMTKPPAIVHAVGKDAILKAVDDAKNNFDDMQQVIRQIVETHSAGRALANFGIPDK